MKYVRKSSDCLLGLFAKLITPDLYRTIKIIDVKPCESISSNQKHFETELKTLKALNHPNLVMIYDMQRIGNKYYLVMDPFEGMLLINYIICQTLSMKIL